MVSCVSWRALGGLDCGRPSPALGSTAVSILCVTRWQSASGMIEWLCIQERWNPDVAIIFFASARYFRAKVNRSDYDAHPYNSTLHTKATLILREAARACTTTHSLWRLGLLQKSTTNRSERHQQKHVTVKPVILLLIYRKTGIYSSFLVLLVLDFWCFWCLYLVRKGL
jgi:hypothetical protein